MLGCSCELGIYFFVYNFEKSTLNRTNTSDFWLIEQSMSCIDLVESNVVTESNIFDFERDLHLYRMWLSITAMRNDIQTLQIQI